MAEKKAVGHAYNIDFLNVVFAASSIFLLLTTVWMVWDDFDREWKGTQRRFNQLQIEVTRAQLEQTTRAVNKAKLAQLQQQMGAADQSIAANQVKIDDLQQKLREVDARLYRATQAAQFTKATYDVDRYAFEVARDKKVPDVAERQKNIEDEAVRLRDSNLELEKVTAERAAANAELDKFIGAKGRTQKDIDAALFEQNRLQKQLDAIQPSAVKNYVLNAPLLDFMAPTLKVNQILTAPGTIVDDVNFAKVQKMDRCTTCHLAIDAKGYEKYPQPFTTHPNLGVYLGSDSPHPLNKTGCTVCHQGKGGATSFVDAVHYPRDEKQRIKWEEEFGWEEPHEWDYPMLPAQMTESSCVQCHRGEVYIPNSPKLTLAYATYERAGCYACHKTRGFEGVRKPGPILTKISAKLQPDWVKTWIRDPRAVKDVTWMPKIWYNSNSSAPSDAVRNEVEINAAVAYLFANSETDYQFPVASPPKGDAGSGEKIVRSVGCLGCHILDETDRTSAGPRRTFGQPLKNIGSKTTYTWLYNWVKDPKHYSPDTFMPNMRLTDPQVADVATFLSGLSGPAGTAAKANPTPQQADEVLLDYLTNLYGSLDAKTRLAKMDTNAKQLDLGQRVISRYGCYSCHMIKGFETTQPIGTELSEEGSKLVTRLDFAFAPIQHSKLAWFHQKMDDPRAFDSGRVLEPLEKLRMPNFGASDTENERLQTALMSFQRDMQLAGALPARTANRDYMIAGRALVRRQNCVGCHEIEGEGGADFKKLVADASLAPPLLTPEGAKVQPDWLYAFFQGPITIRPWLAVRMPTFGFDDARWNAIIRYFGATANSAGPFHNYDGKQLTELAGPGKDMFELMKCQSCHVLGAIPADKPTDNLAPDLRMAHERLQPDWVIRWLIDPKVIQPGTRMTQFWPEYPKTPYPQQGGDAEKQLRSVRDYLFTLRGGPSPKRPANSDSN
jgi:mono/diheme cytochrome c family protein